MRECGGAEGGVEGRGAGVHRIPALPAIGPPIALRVTGTVPRVVPRGSSAPLAEVEGPAPTDDEEKVEEEDDVAAGRGRNW